MRSSLRGIAVCAVAVSVLAASVATAQKKPAPKAPAAKATKYGALAVDRRQGFVFGWAYDHPSRADANSFAMEECSKRNGNCSVVVEFSGEGCASYHTISAEDGTAYGWGTAQTQAGAESRSLQECNAFAGGKATCGNHVWACNSKDVAAFKVLREDPVKAKPAKTDCLVQYEANVETNGDDNWKDRYLSPLYRLAASDCPSTAKTQFHDFYYGLDDRGRPNEGESNPEGKGNPARQAKGKALALQFHQWLSGKTPLDGGLHFRSVGSATVTVASDENLAYLTEHVGQSDSDRVHGICLDYAPPGIEPVASYGAERCRSWVR
jgi:hypothetical protein